MPVPKPSSNFLDLRGVRLAGALRVALGVSLALHIALAVGVKMFWRGQDSAIVHAEMPITIEYSVEAESEKEGASVVALPEPSPKGKPKIAAPSPPAPPREHNRKMPIENVKADAPVEATSMKAVLPLVSPLAEAKPMHAIAGEESMARSIQVAVAPASRVLNGPVKTAAEAAYGGDVAKVKPGILAQPLYRKNPEPAYPAAARRRRQEGVTLLAVQVTATGRAARVAVKQSSGFKLLDDAAAQAARSWEFEPARIGAEAMESEIEVPIRFRLRE